jgi:hypothetical protein
MRRSGKGSGGGLGMNKNASPNYKVGAGSRAVNVDWVGQTGTSLGNKVMGRGEPLRGIRAQPFTSPSFHGPGQGNEIAAATKCGPGGSRTILRTGGQGVQGPVAGTRRTPSKSFD